MPFDATSFDPGAGGADVTWDYSDIVTMGGIETTVAHDAGTIAGSDLFPEANVAWTLDGSAFTFFKSTSSVLENWGSVYNDVDLGFVTVPYSDGEVLLTLPLNYGDDNADDFEATFTVTGFDVVRSGSNTMEADGYGTLVLPSGTIPNVLRVKIVEDYSDEITFLGLTTVYHFEQYFYFKPGTIGAIFQYVHATVDAVGTITEEYVGYFNDDEVVGLEQIETLAVTVFPNPASETITFQLDQFMGLVNIRIMNLQGQVIYTTSSMGGSATTIDVSTISAGSYLLSLLSQGVQYNQMIQID
jgi:hypothetical protein